MKRISVAYVAMCLLFVGVGFFASIPAPTTAGDTSAYDVKDEIKDYQKEGSCQRADLNFDGKVNSYDLMMIAGNQAQGESGWYTYAVPPAPFWMDRDNDKLISIIDVGYVAARQGQTCK